MGTLRYGVHRVLEDAATEMIRRSLIGVNGHEAKRDVLTPWKERDRKSREVFVPSGTPDPALRVGNFNRALSPVSHLNSVNGSARPRRRQSSLAKFVEEHQAMQEIEDHACG